MIPFFDDQFEEPLKVGGERMTKATVGDKEKSAAQGVTRAKRCFFLKIRKLVYKKKQHHRSLIIGALLSHFRVIEKNCRRERESSLFILSLISAVGLRARPERDELPGLFRVPLDDGLSRRHVLAPELPAVAKLADVRDPRGDARVGGDLLVDPREERRVELRVLGEPVSFFFLMFFNFEV